MKREMKVTTLDGKIYLFPIPVVKDRKYLIACSSEEEAKFICLAIQEERVVHPDLISEDFIFLTYHTDRRTKIFYLNPKVSNLERDIKS
jgi:hypothetical protein